MVDCDSLNNPFNGQVNMSSGNTVGSIAIYTCNNGYNLKGSSSRTCGSGGTWTNVVPECNSKFWFGLKA